MSGLLWIVLEAHNASENHHRRYEVLVGRDLLCDWSVTIRYGRAGHGLRETQFGGGDAESLQRLVRRRLGRRGTAQTRIGCDYRVREFVVDPDLDPSDWLPERIADELRSGQGQS